MTKTEDTRGEDRAAWLKSFRTGLANVEQPNLPIEAYDSAVDEVRDLTAEEVDDDRLKVMVGNRVIGLVPLGYFMQPRKFCSNSLVKTMKGIR